MKKQVRRKAAKTGGLNRPPPQRKRETLPIRKKKRTTCGLEEKKLLATVPPRFKKGECATDEGEDSIAAGKKGRKRK